MKDYSAENIVLFKELDFAVKYGVNSHHVEFGIYSVEGVLDDGTILFHKKDSGSYPDSVESIEDSEPYAHGSVKWDGCSNWYFDQLLAAKADEFDASSSCLNGSTLSVR